MKKHRFLIQTPLQEGNMPLEDIEQIHQITSVLRLSQGDEIIIVYEGKEARAQLREITPHKITLFVERIIDCPKPPRDIYLAFSLLRKDNVEWVVQKATEIGVKGIVPFISKRTVKTSISEERLKKIIREAVEQAGWGEIPELYNIHTYEEALDTLTSLCDEVYIADLQTTTHSPVSKDTCGILVGPEGGFVDEELSYAYDKGVKPLTLGVSTLRGETAAILSVYHILYWN